MTLGSTPMFASPSIFKVLEFVTLTVYSEMQYDVQKDHPCCGYSRMF